MKTLILILALAASLMAQVINANPADIPTPVAAAGQCNGGVLVAVEPLEGIELYYFWRDGQMVAWGTEPEFLDYPSRDLHYYQVQVSIDWTRGELCEPIVVDLSEPPLPIEEDLYQILND